MALSPCFHDWGFQLLFGIGLWQRLLPSDLWALLLNLHSAFQIQVVYAVLNQWSTQPFHLFHTPCSQPFCTPKLPWHLWFSWAEWLQSHKQETKGTGEENPGRNASGVFFSVVWLSWLIRLMPCWRTHNKTIAGRLSPSSSPKHNPLPNPASNLSLHKPFLIKCYLWWSLSTWRGNTAFLLDLTAHLYPSPRLVWAD